MNTDDPDETSGEVSPEEYQELQQRVDVLESVVEQLTTLTGLHEIDEDSPFTNPEHPNVNLKGRVDSTRAFVDALDEDLEALESQVAQTDIDLKDQDAWTTLESYAMVERSGDGDQLDKRDRVAATIFLNSQEWSKGKKKSVATNPGKGPSILQRVKQELEVDVQNGEIYAGMERMEDLSNGAFRFNPETEQGKRVVLEDPGELESSVTGNNRTTRAGNNQEG